MSKDKNNSQDAKLKAPKPVPAKVTPLFRKIDWLVLIVVFAVMWTAYLLTLAPELTLEDCGELCTASYYAGIPHPPGYPFWSVYSWIWTVIVPFGNVAWRVEVGESFAEAVACGLVGFMVSRGSSMLIEGIEELKNMSRKWENAICIVSGTVAGLLLGFDGFMWKEAVVINRISLFDVPWIMGVVLCLLRWIYAPHQRRYLYIGMFFFGLCATIHQTMLVASMGIEVCIAMVVPRLGRDLFWGNSLIYVLALIGMQAGKLPGLSGLSPVFLAIFHVVGVCSILAAIWLTLKTKGAGSEWKACVFMLLLWLLGAAFYLYEPISGMTDPPMQWGYPRTLDGFFHAIERGQYAQSVPTDIIHHPGRFMMQLGLLITGLASSYSWVYIFIALLPFFFLIRMEKRERAWIIGLAAIYLCIGVLLTIIMNTSPDRQSAEEAKVFFAASHAVVAILIGYGFTLMVAYMIAHYEKFRRWGLAGGIVAAILALYCLKTAAGQLYFGPAGEINLFSLPHWIGRAFDRNQYGLPIFGNLILLAGPLIFIAALLLYRNRAPVIIALCIFATVPVYSGLCHWYKSEQRNHWFGYWFGHDMFTPPFGIYPPMARNAILFGGTDPGRFCPTYMIFCESFIPHKDQPKQDQTFDRRDVYIITQNALADGTYLEYLRAQYDRSSQNALGLDTPFFRDFTRYVLGIPFGPDNSIVRDISNIAYKLLDVPFTKLGAHVEAERRAEGVYPPKEIYIPTPEDSQNCFSEYTEDVARRQQLGQLRPDEYVHIENGKVQVSGQVAVMMINGLLCKVIFDHNPTNKFYVEESFPLDWMYPYETPSGVIMKIHRNPLPTLTDDIFKKDHEFWSQYSQRLIGNWITYKTTVQQIADFAQKVYLGNNYSGYTGDRKFVRDEDAQKAFSKLRSSIAGVYAWRLSSACPPEYRPKTKAQMDSLIRETDFAFKQSFAFCPYSPEAVYRYVNFLVPLGRYDDALLVAQTCHKLDPYNGEIDNLITNLEQIKAQAGQRAQVQGQLQQLQKEAVSDPSNFENILALGDFYMQMRDTNQMFALFHQSVPLFNGVLANSSTTAKDIAAMAQISAQIGDLPEVEVLLKKLIIMEPGEADAHYDLARLEAILGHNSNSLQQLKIALDLNAKLLATNPAANNILTAARHDPSFNILRKQPEFQKLVPPN